MSGKTEWALHGRLAADCHELGPLPTSYPMHLLLHRNAALHWFILVPETAVVDLLQLPVTEREAVLGEAARIDRFLRDSLGYPRVNVGALGLLVPQLHLHVVGRREDDPCWPAPVWGNLEAGEVYGDVEVRRLREALLPDA